MIIFAVIYYILEKTTSFFFNIYKNSFTTTSPESGKEKPKVEVNLVNTKIDPQILQLLNNHFLNWNKDFISISGKIKNLVIACKKEKDGKIDPKLFQTFLQDKNNDRHIMKLKNDYRKFVEEVSKLGLKDAAKERFEAIKKAQTIGLEGLEKSIDNIKLSYYQHCKNIYNMDVVQQKNVIEVLKKHPDLLVSQKLYTKEWFLGKLEWRIEYLRICDAVKKVDESSSLEDSDTSKLLDLLEEVRRENYAKLVENKQKLQMLLKQHPDLAEFDAKAKVNLENVEYATLDAEKTLKASTKNIQKQLKPLKCAQYSNESESNNSIQEMMSNSIYKDVDIITYILSLFC